ncbi:lipoprotein [Klebsiella grimontii]|nr:lipoprotein [Klebsiella grimontii]
MASNAIIPIRAKKMDYTAVSTFNDRTLGNVSQTCDYDRHDNPVSCELQVVDDSVQLR